MRYEHHTRLRRDTSDGGTEPMDHEPRPRRPHGHRRHKDNTGRTLLLVFGGIGLGVAVLGALAAALIVGLAVHESNKYGKRIALKGESELYYTSSVQEAEAQKLASYLNDSVLLFPTLNSGTFQVSKTGDVYEVRVCVQQGKEKDEAVQRYWAEQGRSMSEKVFDKAPVQVLLCDTEMKPVHTVVRSDRSK